MSDSKIKNKIGRLILILGLIVGFSACKSHKKNVKAESPVAETINIKKDKKDKDSKDKKIRLGDKIAEEALTWVGTPYKYAGSEKGIGTDCSGMVMVIYKETAKIDMPRNSAKQGEFCSDIGEGLIEPGDLVFFAIGEDKTKISHVGIMIDALRFVHASASKGVIISDMETPYYRRNFKKYGRVPGK